MTRMRWILSLLLLIAAISGFWLWWVRPESVDMAEYAPANALLYLESNRPLGIIEAITDTEAWEIAAQVTASPLKRERHPWFQGFIRWTGLGPVQSVILSRAQLAVVITDLGTTEEGDTLKIKPEGAVIIETHTSEHRLRAPVEQNLNKLARITYSRPNFRRVNIEGSEFMEWTSPQGGRQIVAAIYGSLVIVGNTERSVRTCLSVAQKHSPSLKDDTDLKRMRAQLTGNSALSFGYVPSASSPRLLAMGVPLVLGRSPDDAEFQRLLTAAAAKLFGSVGWSSHSFMKGIEDRYLITLQNSVVTRLKQDFIPAPRDTEIQRLIPDNVFSVTYYNFEGPTRIWQDLKSTVASQLDVLSAVLFSSLLKSALAPYGIDEPENFLGAATTELVTLRLDEGGRGLLIAGVRDRATLRSLVTREMRSNSRAGETDHAEMFQDTQNDRAAAFVENFVVMGSIVDVRRLIETKRVAAASSKERSKRITFFIPAASRANIVTYTDDSDRVRNFVSAIVAAKDTKADLAKLDSLLAGLPYSATESTLGEQGIERVTKSPLGQFSTLLPLLFPEAANFKKPAPSP